MHVHTMHAVHMHRLAARTRIFRSVILCTSKQLAPRQTLHVHRKQVYTQNLHRHVLLGICPSSLLMPTICFV